MVSCQSFVNMLAMVKNQTELGPIGKNVEVIRLISLC